MYVTLFELLFSFCFNVATVNVYCFIILNQWDISEISFTMIK